MFLLLNTENTVFMSVKILSKQNKNKKIILLEYRLKAVKKYPKSSCKALKYKNAARLQVNSKNSKTLK